MQRTRRAASLALLLIFLFAGCTPSTPRLSSEAAQSQAESKKLAQEQGSAQYIVSKYTVAPSIDLDLIDRPKQKQADFLYQNSTFNILRDHGFFADYVARTDYLSAVVARFGPPPLRMMGDFIYAVYDTDAGTRVFLFFAKKDGFQHVAGRVALMKQRLRISDFSGVYTGDSIKKVAAVDPVAGLYAHGYDLAEYDWLTSSDGTRSSIATTHILLDGVLRFEYKLQQNGDGTRDYLIEKSIYMPDYILEEQDGAVCYRILTNDFVK
ncbi:MAG: hypothetical protein LBB67_03365 [Oscillospiraceae bacterium]|nr:hypothetical protein [Oscillospiraceae bacterium]